MKDSHHENCSKKEGNKPMHADVIDPMSRCRLTLPSSSVYICNELEVAKFFPALNGGLQDNFRPSDEKSTHDNPEQWKNQPPPDGQIASVSHPGALQLDAAGDHWQKHDYASGSEISITWSYHATHRTRRYNYFCTHPDWDPSQPLTRHQFRTYEADEFDVVYYRRNNEEVPADLTATLGYYDPACRPFHSRVTFCQNLWDPCGLDLGTDSVPFSDGGMRPDSPDIQKFRLPQRTGYHVILCVWEVADTGMGFHALLDINFT